MGTAFPSQQTFRNEKDFLFISDFLNRPNYEVVRYSIIVGDAHYLMFSNTNTKHNIFLCDSEACLAQQYSLM